MKKGILSIFIGVLISTGVLYSAEVNIPVMEIITKANFTNGLPDITNRGKVILGFTGGYKFAGSLSLGFDSSDLGYSNADINDYDGSTAQLADYISKQTYLTFQSAEVTLRNIFSETSSFSYFIGKNDVFCSGDAFPVLFGSYPIATRFRGYLYFPTNEFDGIHRINGTGVKFSTTFGSESNFTSFYLYKDGYLDGSYFSADLRTLFNLDNFKLESFIGTTFPKDTFGIYRGGIMMDYRAGGIGEFMAQIGIPVWNPSEAMDIRRFYFLFEPRINFDMLSIIVTLFWHPGYYLQQETADTGSSNINLNFMVGDLSKKPLAGGIESNITFDSSSGFDSFHIKVTPYISTISSGVVWNMMLHINLFPFTLTDMFEGVVGIKAEF